MTTTSLNTRPADASRRGWGWALGTLLFAATAAAPGSAQLRTVTINVHATVNPALQELRDKYPGVLLPLEGCTVSVQATDLATGAAENWGQDFLDASGRCTFTIARPDVEREIRVFLLFASDDSDDFALELYRQRSDVGTIWRVLAQIIIDSGLATPLELLYCLGDVILHDECTPCQNLILSHLDDVTGFSLRWAAATNDWIPLWADGAVTVDVAEHGGSFGWDETLSFRRIFSNDVDIEDRHANLWVVLRELLRYLDANGFPMNTKLHAVHPANLSSAQDGSFADPLTDGHDTIYLLEDHFNVGSALHEAMHVWAYQRTIGEESLGEYLFEHCTTHGHVSAPVAFHEGFAEASKFVLRRELYPATWGARLPYNRYALNNDPDDDFDGPITNIAQMQRHDLGWSSFLLMLMTPNLGSYEFGTDRTRAGSVCAGLNDEVIVRVGSSTEDASLEFLELLDVVNGMNVNVANQVEFSGFLLRVATLVPGFDAGRVDELLQLADPASTYEPDWAPVGTWPTDLALEVDLAGPLQTDPISGARSLLFRATVTNVHEEERASPSTLTLKQTLSHGGSTSTSSTTAVPALNRGASRQYDFTIALPASGSGSAWTVELDWQVQINNGQCDELAGSNRVVVQFGDDYLAPDYVPDLVAFDASAGTISVRVTNEGPVAASRDSVLRVRDYESGATAVRTVPALAWNEHRTYHLALPIVVSDYELRMVGATVDALLHLVEGEHTRDGDLIDGETNNSLFVVYGGSRMQDLLTSTLSYADDRFEPGFEPPIIVEPYEVEWSYAPADWVELYFQNAGNGPIDPTGPIDGEEILQAAEWLVGRYTYPTNWVNEAFSQAAAAVNRVGKDLQAVLVFEPATTRVVMRPPQQ
ncbi:MAG: hypothetical protein AB7Q17_06125 [Phycisphaerae bacterium]